MQHFDTGKKNRADLIQRWPEPGTVSPLASLPDCLLESMHRAS
jgi:hypothetical protein